MNRNATATILIVLAIGIYFTVTRGIMAETKGIKAVNAQYESAIANAEKLIQVREQVLKSYNAISEEDRNRLEKMIPNTVDTIRLMIDLNSVAAQHGLSLKGLTAKADAAANKAPTASAPPSSSLAINGSPQTPAMTGNIPTPTLDTVTVNFTVDAPYLEFINFLHDIEANLRLMDISHLSLATSEDGDYSFTVELKTYWLRQQ